MDKTYHESLLYRIIQGRLRLPFIGPDIYLYEPDAEILEESYDVYKKAYDEAYFDGTYIKEELKEVLFYNEMWSPEDDKIAKEAESEIERLKVHAYENYHNVPVLRNTKRGIRLQEENFRKHKSKFHSLDHISCEGVAALAKSIWVISKTIKNKQGVVIDKKDMPLTKVMEYYNSKAISSSEYRFIARNDPFRGMWTVGKKQSNIFGRASIELTGDQIALCQYSSMYDNVNESPESPHEDVINDDDCLDGWFIMQRREYESSKNKREMEKRLGNSKIANSQEVYLMAGDGHTADKINNMNDVVGRGIIQNRNSQIENTGTMKHTQLSDVQQQIHAQRHQQAIQKIKGR